MSIDPAPAPRKFMFDRSFDDATIVHRAERKPVLMKPEQVDALRKEGFDAGMEAGRQAAQEEQDTHLAQLMNAIDQKLDRMLQSFADMLIEQDEKSKKLALGIAKKFLPAFIDRHGIGELEILIADAIRDMAREPRLVVRVHEEQFDIINERVQALAGQRAYAGKMIVLGDAEIAKNDCRVEWADGGIERNGAALWAAVETTIIPAGQGTA